MANAKFPMRRFRQFLKELKVQTKDYGLQRMDRLLGTQEYFLAEIAAGMEKGQTTFVVLKARQLGMTTICAALDLFWMMEYAGLSAALGAHSDLLRDQFRATMDNFLVHLPPTHKIRKKAHNRGMLILENGSQMSYLVAGTREKASAGLGRGGAYNFQHCTEVAYWGSEGDVQELEATMSTHYPHRLQIYESTANGFNFYQRMWEDARASSVIGTIFVGWWRNQLYAFDKDHQYYKIFIEQGPLSVLEKKRIRYVKEQYDYDITLEQIAWYRWQLEAKQGGDQMKMDELFPWTSEDAFVASGSRFFTNESLTDAMRNARKQPFQPFRYLLGEVWSETGVVDASRSRGREDLRIWEHPDPLGVYAIGCDPAYGSSETADRHCVSVYRTFADRIIQVAEFASSIVATYHCAWVLMHLSGYYRNVMVNLEVSGPGAAVFQEMRHLQRQTALVDLKAGEQAKDIRSCLTQMQYYLYSRPDSMRGDLCYQWKMNHDNKHMMMTSFRDSLQLSRIVVNSMLALEECKSMVYEDGSIMAEGRKKDDRVIASALAHEAWRRWQQPMLQARGATFKAVMEAQKMRETSVVSDTVARHIDFLRRSKMRVG